MRGILAARHPTCMGAICTVLAVPHGGLARIELCQMLAAQVADKSGRAELDPQREAKRQRIS